MVEKINCKYQKQCGNCQLLNKTYEETLKFKLESVNDYLKQNKINYKVKDIIKADLNIGYRNKMILAYKYQNGKVVTGFYEENSHKIVDIDSCVIHSDLQNTIAREIKKIIIDLKIKPYDEDRRIGLLRYVLIREAVFKKEILITLVTASDVFPARSEVVKRIRNISPLIKTVIQNINPRKTSIVLGDKERVLFGNGFISDNLKSLTFNIGSKSFYQVNPYQTEKLYTEVEKVANLNKTDTIIDAYSGVGTIGMILSKHVKNVISVENNKQAVDAAIVNSKINNIKNVRFICDDATNFIVQLAKERAKIDVVVMDPPRTGSTVQFINAINSLNPRKVIYVSCGPDTLARDLVLLTKKYDITNMVCVDMFCWSNHVETVVLLSHKILNNISTLK